MALYPFETTTVDTPWNKTDIDNYLKNGSRYDPVIYNPLINARFVLEDWTGEGVSNCYSCNIKLKNGYYHNFGLLPLTRNKFFFIVRIPKMAKIIKHEENNIFINVIEKYPLLKSIRDSCIFSDKYVFDSNFYISKDGIICMEVMAPVEHILFPREQRITNDLILDSFKKLCSVYYNIKLQMEPFIIMYGKAIERTIEQYQVLERKQKEIENKLKRIEEQEERIKRKAKNRLIRLGVRLAAASITAGTSEVVFGAVDCYDAIDNVSTAFDFLDSVDTFSDMEDLFDIVDIMEVGDLTDFYDGISIMSDDIIDLDGLSDVGDFSEILSGSDDSDYFNGFEEMEEMDLSSIGFRGNHYDDNTEHFVKIMKENGVEIPSNVDKTYNNKNVVTMNRHSSGGMLASDKHQCRLSIDKALRENKITDEIYDKLIKALNSC